MRKSFIILPTILLVLVFIISSPCDKYLSCTGKWMNILQYPGLWFLFLLPLSLFALVLNNQKHKFWLKFTGIFFAISMIFVFLAPEHDSAIVSLDQELANWFLLGLYSVISIVYFILQFLQNRK